MPDKLIRKADNIWKVAKLIDTDDKADWKKKKSISWKTWKWGKAYRIGIQKSIFLLKGGIYISTLC